MAASSLYDEQLKYTVLTSGWSLHHTRDWPTGVLCSCAITVQAAQKPKGSVERLLLVAAFAVSAFQSVAKLKASTPMMGETVEVHTLGARAPLRNRV